MRRLMMILSVLLGVILFVFCNQGVAEEKVVKESDKKTVKKEKKKAKEEAKKEYGVIETKFGKIVIEFFPKVAPNHIKNFKKLAEKNFYNGTTFHRVIPGFMIQGGDPNSKDSNRANDGLGGPGYTVNAEFSKLKHKRGIVSMARAADPNSAGSQFFICVADQPRLDEKYTVFGKVIEGMDAVDKIVMVKRDTRDNPLEKVEMKKVFIKKK